MSTNPKGNVPDQRKRYKLKYPERRKAERSKYKKLNPDKNCKWKKRSVDKARYEAIDHYSSGSFRCVNCWESHYEFLEIDHINGGGNEHKRTIKETSLPVWLRNNNYPPGFQVLCSNCNNKKVKIAARKRGDGGTVRQRKYYRRNTRERMRALTHYTTGNKIQCDCCGETDIDVLCLDHKNGDGADHRKGMKQTDKGNAAKWTRKNGYPDIFRVLCHNCNQSLGKYGYCPHKLPTRYDTLDPKVQTYQP